MILQQFIYDDLGCASYLVADEGSGRAAIVDPQLDVDAYLEFARRHRLRIDHVVETHTHADHVSGRGLIVRATGSTTHLSAADLAFSHDRIVGSWELALGAVVVRALSTPGHRPEHTAFELIDRSRSDDPIAILSGDSLFVGDVGRPDLADQAELGAREMHRSLNRLLELPDRVEVWPGHLGGSICGGPSMDRKPSTTIGTERHLNRLASIADAGSFAEQLLSGLSHQPPNFGHIVELNRREIPGEDISVRWLGPAAIARLYEHTIIDVRDDAAYDLRHLCGSICVPIDRFGFGTKIGWLVEPGTPLAFVGDSQAQIREVAKRAAAAGHGSDHVGMVDPGLTRWTRLGRPTASIERLDAEDFADCSRRGEMQVIDVRESGELAPGAIRVPYFAIADADDLDLERPIATVCSSGHRAAIAASLLQRRGASRVIHVAGCGACAIRAPLTSRRKPQ